MKLRVQRRDGAWEVITMVPPATIHLGDTLNDIRESSGVDHYFTLDGFYDGWGGMVPQGEDYQAMMDRIEAGREIEGHPATDEPQ